LKFINSPHRPLSAIPLKDDVVYVQFLDLLGSMKERAIGRTRMKERKRKQTPARECKKFHSLNKTIQIIVEARQYENVSEQGLRIILHAGFTKFSLSQPQK
jgi:hypothetical protein